MAVWDALAPYVKQVGRDEEGLGQWSWILIQGTSSAPVRFICAYQPVKGREGATISVYAQQSRYFRIKGQTDCPRNILKKQLITFVDTCLMKGEKVILMMDANEHVIQVPLGKKLKNLVWKKCICNVTRNVDRQHGFEEDLPSMEFGAHLE